MRASYIIEDRRLTYPTCRRHGLQLAFTMAGVAVEVCRPHTLHPGDDDDDDERADVMERDKDTIPKIPRLAPPFDILEAHIRLGP